MSGFEGFTNPFPKFSTNNGVCGIFGICAQRARIPRKEKYLWNIGKDILKNIFDSLTSGVNKKAEREARPNGLKEARPSHWAGAGARWRPIRGARKGEGAVRVDRTHHARSRVGPACLRHGSRRDGRTRGAAQGFRVSAVHARAPDGPRMRRAHAQPVGAPWTVRAREGGKEEAADRLGSVKAEVAPTWRLRGSHAGRREEEEGGAAKWTADGGRVHRSKALPQWKKKAHRGREGKRGSEPTARIRRKEAGGSGLRRRAPLASKGGKRRRSTRDQFKAVGVSPGFKEFIPGVGWGRATPWRSGDERRPPGASGDGGKPMAGGGEARGFVHARSGGLPSYRASYRRERASGKGERREALPSRDGRCDERPTARERALRPRAGKGEEDGCPESRVTRPRTHRSSRCSAADGDGESRGRATMARWSRSVKREGLRWEGELGFGFYRHGVR
uniref:OSJNBb0020O11.3 protein n=1 Tax=Oryza sativa subsp. japonica TaxID=39947 RepID=Q7XU67_ORYSJ|nr:OSJNBb0020O11.3 [Oryza sativa Japonica Group]